MGKWVAGTRTPKYLLGDNYLAICQQNLPYLMLLLYNEKTKQHQQQQQKKGQFS